MPVLCCAPAGCDTACGRYKVPKELNIFRTVASPMDLSVRMGGEIARQSVSSAAPLSPVRPQVNTIISRVTGRDRAKFEAKFAKKSKAEDAYHEKKEYVQEL